MGSGSICLTRDKNLYSEPITVDEKHVLYVCVCNMYVVCVVCTCVYGGGMHICMGSMWYSCVCEAVMCIFCAYVCGVVVCVYVVYGMGVVCMSMCVVCVWHAYVCDWGCMCVCVCVYLSAYYCSYHNMVLQNQALGL